MTVKIGHAASDENGKAKGGTAGNQSGKELLIQDWYLRKQGWTCVFRAKDSKAAEKIATAMVQACVNNNIGYDQGHRTTLYTQAEKCNFDLSKITKKCECDCSSLVAVCIRAAGITVSKDMYTGNQKAVITGTGAFEVLSDPRYLTKPDYLERGDILLGPGHTAIVIASNTKELAIDAAKSFSKAFTGTYIVSASKLNVRYGAGLTKSIITTIPKGTIVKCYGYYTKILSTNWFYVQFTYQGTLYTGFVSSRYLTK